MKMNIKKTLAVTALALSSGLFAVNSYATAVGLNGSSSIGSAGATITGADLSNPGLITVTTPFYGTNTGDFSPLATFSFFTLAGSLDLTNMATWDITGPAGTFGSYVVSALNIVYQDANNLNVYTRGLFTPGSTEGTQAGGCATGSNTCDTTDTSLRWSFTLSGGSVSASGTLNSPAVPLNVPEPVTLSMLGLGLVGWAANRRRKAA